MNAINDKLASEQVLAQAYEWLCEARSHHRHNADVWHLRHGWDKQKILLQAQLRAGLYRLGECSVVRGQERTSEIWSAMDALVLKALAIVLTEHLRPHLSPRCFHLAGTGGLKGAIREVASHVTEHTFAFRTDVKGYYASINHTLLYAQVRQYVDDEPVLNLVHQYLKRVVSDGGNYRDIELGKH